MKTILKTIPSELDMNYEETFNSQSNIEIRRKLIPELVKALKLNHCASRSRNIYKNKGRLDSDNCHLHANGRLNEV